MRCTFCDGSLRFAFRRSGATWDRCEVCGAYLRTDRRTIESDVYDNSEFIHRIESSIGTQPNFKAYDEMAPLLREGSILEIGVGSGHLLAAAKARGRKVAGVEQSPRHREYVRQRWGIEVTEQLPAGAFNNIVSVNVFEHLADPFQHLIELRKLLSPSGRICISTANADCLVATLCGRWWAMFKPPDHFSIPSASSLRMVAKRAQLTVERIWCSEYPLETPVGIAIAVRDRLKQTRAESPAHLVLNGNSMATGRAQRIRELRAFNFVGSTFARFMIANSIKAIFENR